MNSNKKSNTKPKLKFALVQFCTDKQYAVVSLNKVSFDADKEIEINALYDVLWEDVQILAEIKYLGNELECQDKLKNISYDEKTKKRVLKNLENNENSEKNKKKKIEIAKSSGFKQYEIESNISNKKNKENSSELLKKADDCDKNDGKKSLSSNSKMTPNLSSAYDAQIDERNKIIEKLTKENENILKQNEQLKDQLNMAESLQDQGLRKKMVKFSMQCIRYLASNTEKEDLKKICEDSDIVSLISGNSTVTVTKYQYDCIMMSIGQKKTSKATFKDLMKVLIPDVNVWGSNNGEYMRKNYGTILQVAREFLATKEVVLSEADFKTALRDLCSKFKGKMAKLSPSSSKNTSIDSCCSSSTTSSNN